MYVSGCVSDYFLAQPQPPFLRTGFLEISFLQVGFIETFRCRRMHDFEYSSSRALFIDETLKSSTVMSCQCVM